MRIAVWHDPPPGGAQRSFSEVLARLARRHDLQIFRLGHCGSGDTGEQAYGLPVEVIPFAPRPHRRLGLYWNDFQTLRDLIQEGELERRVARRIDDGAYDVLLASVLRWGCAPAVLRYARTPTVYFCHEPPRRFYEPWCRPEAGPLTPFERGRMVWRWPAQRMIDQRMQSDDLLHVRSADTVLTNSEYTRGRIESVYGRAADVCYLGVDTDRFYPGTVPDRPPAISQVLSVGALEPHKGFDFVIEALGRVSARRRPVLMIVGNGGHPRMPEHLYRLAQRHGVALHIRSGVCDQELQQLYQSSSAFLFGAHHEPFGLVLLEAMASGVPVVAVGEGGIPEIVEDGQTGYLTERDPSAFAERVERLQGSPRLRAEMARNARAGVLDRWTWESSVARFEAHLEGAATPQRAIAQGMGS